MDWNELRIFLNVARHGNLAGAARALHVDPTTISRRLSALERDLERTLFERSGEGFTLTAQGRALLPHAEDMEQAAGRIELARASRRHLTGQLRISVSEGFGAHFIAPHIGVFAAAHPELEIDLVASSGFLNPSKREADLAILLTRPHRGLLKVRKLTEYRLALYAPSSRADWRDRISAGGLKANSIPVIGYIPDFIYAPELRYLDEIESGLAATIRCSSITAQREMISSGAGIGVLPRFMADRDARLVRILPDRSIQRAFWLAVHRDLAPHPRVRAFVDWFLHLLADQNEVLDPDD